MTITIPERLIEPLQAVARLSGVSAEEYVQELLESELRADLQGPTEDEVAEFENEILAKVDEALNDPRPSVPWTKQTLAELERRVWERHAEIQGATNGSRPSPTGD